MAQYDELKLSNQLCHPIYSAANALNRLYKPLLEPLGLTYPQYLILLSLWERDGVNLNAISEATYFDSGTLTPLVQKLKKSGLIDIQPDKSDRRNKVIRLTKKGEKLKAKAVEIPKALGCLFPISRSEAEQLVRMIRSMHQAILKEEKKRAE